MHVTETIPNFGYFSRIFLPLLIMVMIPVGIYFFYMKILQPKRLFFMICILFLALSLVRGYLKKYYIVPEPIVPVKQAYNCIFFDKNCPEELEKQRQIYLRSLALHPNLYYLHDFILNPLWYSLGISLIPLGIYTFFRNFFPGARELFTLAKELRNRIN